MKKALKELENVREALLLLFKVATPEVTEQFFAHFAPNAVKKFYVTTCQKCQTPTIFRKTPCRRQKYCSAACQKKRKRNRREK